MAIDQYEIAEVLQDNTDSGEALGLFVNLKNNNVTIEQFRQPASKAFEARN